MFENLVVLIYSYHRHEILDPISRINFNIIHKCTSGPRKLINLYFGMHFFSLVNFMKFRLILDVITLKTLDKNRKCQNHYVTLYIYSFFIFRRY
jgi:hypothetical protein